MRKLEVFFDYTCPYCLRGHEYLTELLPQFPDIEIVWRPCEAHPRPERYGLHSDLCIQGFFYAQEHGADIWEYHRRMYDAALKERVNIEDAEVIAGRIHGLLDPVDFLKALSIAIILSLSCACCTPTGEYDEINIKIIKKIFIHSIRTPLYNQEFLRKLLAGF